MNIFVTDPSPQKSAQALDNRRLNKMMLESVQLFGYAMKNLGIGEQHFPRRKDGAPYSSEGAHRKHPCTLWLQQSQGNFQWLLDHLKGMADEYEFRYGRQCVYVENIEHLEKAESLWPVGPLTPFQNSSLFKDEEDVVAAYRETMAEKWNSALSSGDKRKSVSFGKRGAPAWFSSWKNTSHEQREA
jgi:hypothetical protein